MKFWNLWASPENKNEKEVIEDVKSEKKSCPFSSNTKASQSGSPHQEDSSISKQSVDAEMTKKDS